METINYTYTNKEGKSWTITNCEVDIMSTWAMFHQIQREGYKITCPSGDEFIIGFNKEGQPCGSVLQLHTFKNIMKKYQENK